jgi:polysaccharide deacetylase 2 family uncharacterized protein YibQ
MAADDLGAPLRRQGIHGVLRKLVASPLRLAIAFSVSALVVVFVWLNLNPDPLGGEPVVVVRLDDAGQSAGATARPTDLGMRTGLRTEDPSSDVVERGAEPEMAGASEETAPAGGDIEPARKSLGKAPQAGLSEAGRFGPLPRIAVDGRRPSQVYARTPPPPPGEGGHPLRIAVVIGGMGLSASGTNTAIRRLPPEVTLAFAPYPKDLQSWVDKARRFGHEVMLQIPMEPFDYPSNDPGPYTLLTTETPKENLQRLDWLMSRFAGYFGVTNYMGAKFTANADALRPAFKQLSARGLVYIDDGTSARSQTPDIAAELGLGTSAADLMIDAEQTPEAIDAMLEKLETIARERGFALGVGSGLPVTIDRIVEWSQTLDDKDISLVPASASVPGGQT